ncbi:MAG TPA: TMEM175 family protein, partial [Oxalicibacterium sp.]|nr:TMEM175 family protein [Oxalicibacterium sp.]
MKVPHGETLDALLPLLPVFLSYVLSFIYVGIYWNNHHHMLHATDKVTGPVLWANLHLLFWLSLIPFTTGWMGENHIASAPAALYGGVLLMCSIAYMILQRLIIASQGEHSVLKKAIGRDWKGKVSSVLYAVAIPAAFLSQKISIALYVFVALMWLVPDKRIERALSDWH